MLGNHQPCDIYGAAGSPCVAAHSVTRALYASYSGPLYQIVRTSDRQSINVSTLSAGGYADGAKQKAFCGTEDDVPTAAPSDAPWAPGPCCGDVFPQACPNHCDKKSPGACPKDPGCVGCASCGNPKRAPNLSKCMMTRIFDQSGNKNHLHVVGQPSGLEPVGSGGRLFKGGAITGTNASADPLFIDGHAVYSAYFEGGMGFRTNQTTAIPTGDDPETLLMVTSGKHFNGGCCFDVSSQIGVYAFIAVNFLSFHRSTGMPRSEPGPTPRTISRTPRD